MRKYWLGIIAVLLAIAPSGILYMTQVYPNGTGSDIDTSINVGSDTKVFWNGRDRTSWTTGAESYADLPFESVSLMDTSENFHPPILGFSAAPVNPQTMHGDSITPETQLAIFWRVGNKSYSYGRNGKQLARLSFSGLEDDELIALTPNGVIVQIKDTGTPRVLSVELKDKRGVKTKSEFTFYESIPPTVAESASSAITEKELPAVADDVLEFASFVADSIIRPNFREYGLSSNLGIASISCAIPQYGYADKELKKVELERYLIFLNDEAAQFITVSADGGMQSDSGESYPAITKFLAQNLRVCLVSAGAKGFLKSPEDAIQIADYSNMVPYDGPDVTAADIIGIKNDDLIYVSLDTTVLKEYRTIVE